MLGCTTVGCDAAEIERPKGGSALIAIDSLSLPDADISFVGEASGFLVTDSLLVISDKRNAVLHSYNRRGGALGDVGRRGQGPAEWAGGPTVIVRADSMLLIGDVVRIQQLGLSRLDFSGSFPKVGQSIPVAATPRHLFLSSADATARTTLLRRSLYEGTIEQGGPFPTILGKARPIAPLFAMARLAALTEDSLAVVVQSADSLFLAESFQSPWKAIALPVVHRRGAMTDLLDKIDERVPASIERALYQPSYPALLDTLGNRSLLLFVAADMAMKSGRMTAKFFVSVIDLTSRRVCADAPLPISDDPLPQLASRGDTLFALYQADDRSGTSRTIVKSWRINGMWCE